MGRPREFDEAAVLDAATACFWKDGYETTSVRDLAASMRITGASLYNAFGDKRSLYLRALDNYLASSVHDRIARLAVLPPLAALHAFFGEIIDRSASDPEQRGCMLVNAALELAPRDEAVRAIVARELSVIEAFFFRCIAAGQADGSIRDGQPAGKSAAMLLGVLVGIRVLARVRPNRTLLEAAAQAALAPLRPESPDRG